MQPQPSGLANPMWLASRTAERPIWPAAWPMVSTVGQQGWREVAGDGGDARGQHWIERESERQVHPAIEDGCRHLEEGAGGRDGGDDHQYPKTALKLGAT